MRKAYRRFGCKITFQVTLCFGVPAILLFALGCYLSWLHGRTWIGAVFGIGAVLIFGPLGAILQHTFLRRFRCPDCGAKPAYSTDFGGQVVYRCAACGIEWDIGYNARGSS